MAALPQVIQQFASVIRSLSPAKRITLLTLVLGTAAGLTFLMTWSGGVEFRTLFGNLDPPDAGAVVAKLKEQKIPYRIGADGRTVMVPAESIHEVRMQLASDGLPQGSGVGFEVFDNTKLGMSEFAQNVNYQRALQGELARTIARIGEVESCRVHLVMAEKTLFLNDEQPASASVAVKLKTGRRLSQEQINGIVHLVSSSVPRLSPDQVTVVDNSGKLLAGPKGKTGMGALSLDQLEYQAQVEKNLEGRVKSMLEQALGDGKAIVRLACSLDFQRQEKTEEHYLPDNRVIRSEQSLNEASRNADITPQGVPGVRSNTPGPDLMQNQTTGPGTSSFEKQDRTVNYEIGKITSRILEPVGRVTRVSVAVLVDGTYKTPADKGSGTERDYVPRSAEEMQKIEALVKRAVNFDPDRGDNVEVVNIPFEASEWSRADEAKSPSGWLSLLEQTSSYLRHGFIGFFLLLTFLFFIRPLVRWLTERPPISDAEIVKQLPKTVGELEHELAGVKSLPSLDEASLLVASDSDASVGVMRNWLSEKR
jgi:flagellar M-ring protein FliF